MKMKKRGRQAKTHTIFRPLYTCPDKYFFRKKANTYITQCQIFWHSVRMSLGTGRPMKMKVVKWCQKNWNEHNLMYHKKCEIMEREKIGETAQTTKFADFSFILCGNGPNESFLKDCWSHLWMIKNHINLKNNKMLPEYINFRSADVWETDSTSLPYM